MFTAQSPFQACKASAVSQETSIQKLIDCLKFSCHQFSNNDPRAYHLQVMRSIAHSIKDLGQDLSDMKRWQLVQETIVLPDGYVKEAALNLLATLPPSDEARELFIKEVLFFHDDKLVVQSVGEIQKYLFGTDRERMMMAISTVYKSGSPNVKRALSGLTQQLLNDQTINDFARLARNLPPLSLNRERIARALMAYQQAKMQLGE